MTAPTRGERALGIVLGAAAGEALGGPVDGMTRAAIIRAHGRVVRVTSIAPEPGPLTRAFLARLSAGGVRDDAQPPEVDLLLAVVAGYHAAGDVQRALATATAAGGEDGPDPATSRGSRLVAAAATLASVNDLSAPLPVGAVLAALTTAAGRELGAPLAALVDQVRSPPTPSAAAAPYAELPAPLALAFLALHALLVRPGSIAEAVTYATNLGGNAAGRAALTGALAGLHRGALCVPEQWIGHLHLAPLLAAAAALETDHDGL